MFAIVGGDNQTGMAGRELPNPIKVQALDSKGHPARGLLVNFRAVTGGGRLFAGSALTDNQGYAQDYWTLGPGAGPQTVEVVSVDPTTGAKTVHGSFTANATPLPQLTVHRAGNGSGNVTSSPGGIACGFDCSESYDGTVVTLTATADPGSTFTNWSGACTGAGACVVTMSASASVTATFTLNQHTLTVTRAGSGSGAVTSAPVGISCGAGCVEAYDHGTSVVLVATAAPGSEFAGWSGACSGTGVCAVSMTAAASVTATFNQLVQRLLTVTNSGSGGTVVSDPFGIYCGFDCQESYQDGTIVTLTAFTNAGALFVGWAGSCTGAASTCVVTMSAARNVTATFAPQQYQVTVARTGSGAGTVTSTPVGISCGATCLASFNAGALVQLTATPNAGSTFTGWSGACSGTGACILSIDGPKAVTATFALAPHVLGVAREGTGTGVVTSSPAGINCGATCLAPFDDGSMVTLTATPASNSFFTGWSGACTGSSETCVLTMNAAASVTATFTVIEYGLTVSVSSSGGTGSIVSTPFGIYCGALCGASFPSGTFVTLSVTADPGSAFLGWSGACTGNGPCVVTMNASKSVSATFGPALKDDR